MKWITLFLFAELLSIILVSSALGALQTIGLLALAVLFGFLLLFFNSGFAVSIELLRQRSLSDYLAEQVDILLRVIAALLLIFPGFFSDALALLFLLLPSEWILGRLGRKKHPNKDRIIDVDFTKK